MTVPAIPASQMTGHQTLMTITKRHIIGHLLQKLSLFFFHFLVLNLTGKVEKHLLVRTSLTQIGITVFIEPENIVGTNSSPGGRFSMPLRMLGEKKHYIGMFFKVSFKT